MSKETETMTLAQGLADDIAKWGQQLTDLRSHRQTARQSLLDQLAELDEVFDLDDRRINDYLTVKRNDLQHLQSLCTHAAPAVDRRFLSESRSVTEHVLVNGRHLLVNEPAEADIRPYVATCPMCLWRSDRLCLACGQLYQESAKYKYDLLNYDGSKWETGQEEWLVGWRQEVGLPQNRGLIMPGIDFIHPVQSFVHRVDGVTELPAEWSAAFSFVEDKTFGHYNSLFIRARGAICPHCQIATLNCSVEPYYSADLPEWVYSPI